jgi:hypothetical protein
MISSSTLFVRTKASPTLASDGVVFSPEIVWIDGAPRVWAHGVVAVTLSADDALDGRALAQSTFITAITEASQLGQSASLAEGRELLADHGDVIDRDGARVLELYFSVDLTRRLERLATLPFHVHATLRGHRSQVHRIALPPASMPDSTTVSDPLIAAHSLARASHFRRAAEAFDVSVNHRRILGDLDGGHLFDTACSATHAARLDDTSTGHFYEGKAVRALEHEIAYARTVARGLPTTPMEGRGTRARERRRAALEARLARIPQDPDLAWLRARPSWAIIADMLRIGL